MYYRKHNLQNERVQTLSAENSNAPIEDNVESVPQQTAENSPYSGSLQSPQKNGGLCLMQALYTGAGRCLLPFVKARVDENIYDGSPILRDIGPDRASVDKIIADVLGDVQNVHDEAAEICLDQKIDEWNEHGLLFSLAEVLVLTEIFLAKRKNESLTP